MTEMAGTGGASGSGGLFGFLGSFVNFATNTATTFLPVARNGVKFGVEAAGIVASELGHQFMNSTYVSDFLEKLEAQNDFDLFLQALLPSVYLQICVRYLLPLVMLLSMLLASVFGLYYTGELAKVGQLIMRGCDKLSKKTEGVSLYFIRLLAHAYQYAVAVRARFTGVTVNTVRRNNLRRTIIGSMDNIYDTVEELNDPIKMLFTG